MTALARSLEQAYPETNRQRTAIALPEVRARDKNANNLQFASLLLGLVALVLLVACANVANLMLTHATGRNREIAVRLAMGASRRRLVRQLLTESLLLAAGGGVCGLALAYGGVHYLSTVAQTIVSWSDLSIVVDFRLDQRVLLFTLAISLATSVAFGLTPALRSTRVDLVPALKASTNTGRNQLGWFSTRGLLVASQVALSVVVLAVAGLSLRHFQDVRRTDPGFRTDHTLLLRLDPSIVGYDKSQMRQFYDRVVTRTRALSGVEAVGLAQSVPLVDGLGTTGVVVDGFDMPKEQQSLSIRSDIVDSGYWSAMGIPIMRGRAFDDRDTDTSPLVVVVNETMARRYWPNRNAIGRTVRLGSRSAPQAMVIGIAKDGKYNTISEPAESAVFIPFSQKNNPWMAATMIVRATGDATTFAAAIRSEIKTLDPAMPVFNVRSLERVYETKTILQERLQLQIISSLAMLAMVLAIVGLYGVMAYLTSLRTREIGIRMALGADRRSVLLMVLRQAAGMVSVGVGVGLVLAYFLTPAFASAFNFVPRDTTILATVSLVLTAAAFLASSIPARRAAMVNPMVALRDE